MKADINAKLAHSLFAATAAQCEVIGNDLFAAASLAGTALPAISRATRVGRVVKTTHYDMAVRIGIHGDLSHEFRGCHSAFLARVGSFGEAVDMIEPAMMAAERMGLNELELEFLREFYRNKAAGKVPPMGYV